ncbi:MAG: S1/P1 nuclease [Pyrinomonadaceae bacterium]
MLKIKFLFLLIVCFTPLVSAFAWDDVGHKTVAYIAWQKMTPQAREQAIKILRGAPEDSDLAAYFMQDARNLAAREMDYFMLAATWSDIVRDRDFKTRYKKYHHGTWHYLDTFWRDVNGKPEIVTGLEDAKENAVERLFFFDKMIRDNSASAEDKAIALAWIMHLAGDIHQPLHASGRVTDLEPKGDQGGNLFLLTPKGTPRDKSENLHWFWDSIIIRNVPRGDSCDSDYIPNIANQIVKKYPEAKFASRLDLGKFDEWQQESYRIASTKLYPASLKRFEMPSPAYKKMAFQISQEQIALAGYRLGAMLNQILGEQSAQLTKENFIQNKDKFSKQLEISDNKVGTGKDDLWLWAKTRSALAMTNSLNDSIIAVDVVNNVVTLRGEVTEIGKKIIAEKITKNVEGVMAVNNQLKVSKEIKGLFK